MRNLPDLASPSGVWSRLALEQRAFCAPGVARRCLNTSKTPAKEFCSEERTKKSPGRQTLVRGPDFCQYEDPKTRMSDMQSIFSGLQKASGAGTRQSSLKRLLDLRRSKHAAPGGWGSNSFRMSSSWSQETAGFCLAAALPLETAREPEGQHES
jgi:hypothetical protein